MEDEGFDAMQRENWFSCFTIKLFFSRSCRWCIHAEIGPNNGLAVCGLGASLFEERLRITSERV